MISVIFTSVCFLGDFESDVALHDSFSYVSPSLIISPTSLLPPYPSPLFSALTPLFLSSHFSPLFPGRLFGGGVKPGKQAPVTTMENMKNSTVISNPHTSSVQQGGALESPSASASSSSPLYGVGGGAGGRGGLEPTLSPLASSPGSALSTPSQSHSLAWSPASPSPSLGYPGGYPSLGSLATSTASMDVSLVSAGGGVVGGHHGGARHGGAGG